MAVKSFFDIMNVIMKKQPIPSDEDIQKHCNQWMLNMYMSCDMTLAPLAAELAKYNITNKQYFDLLYNAIPKNNKFIKWEASKAKKEQDIKYIMEYFGCSYQIAKQYNGIMDDAEIKTIREGFENRGMRK